MLRKSLHDERFWTADGVRNIVYKHERNIVYNTRPIVYTPTKKKKRTSSVHELVDVDVLTIARAHIGARHARVVVLVHIPRGKVHRIPSAPRPMKSAAARTTPPFHYASNAHVFGNGMPKHGAVPRPKDERFRRP